MRTDLIAERENIMQYRKLEIRKQNQINYSSFSKVSPKMEEVSQLSYTQLIALTVFQSLKL